MQLTDLKVARHQNGPIFGSLQPEGFTPPEGKSGSTLISLSNIHFSARTKAMASGPLYTIIMSGRPMLRD